MRNFGEFFDNQVQYAGAIIMSRTDIVDEKKAMESMELLRSINEKAAIITTPIEKLDGKKILEVMEHPVSLADELLKEEHEHHHHHDHDECDCGHDHDHGIIITTMMTADMTAIIIIDHDEECGCGHGHDEHHHHDHDEECGCEFMITSIIITTMTSAAADMTTIMSIIITTMMTNVAADIIMIITIITQTKYLPAGDVRLLRSLQEKGLRKCWRAFLLLKSMA